MAPYLAPEITKGESPNPGSDMYALGVLLHELLTARLPFNADSPSAMAAKHASEPVPSLRSLNPSVPVVLDELVKKLLSKRPDERYRHAGELLDDLLAIQEALRFGRSLTWPISNRRGVEGGPVAPKMSAIREAPEVEVAKRRREGGDVPAWMIGMFVLVLLGLIGVVGAWATFNMNRPKLVTVPNIRGTSLVEARQTLDALRLDLRVSGRVFSNQYPAETVLETNPAAGEKVKERSFVQVRISAGSKNVQVPDITGLTIDEAKTALAKLNLELGEPPEEVRSSSFPPGQVVSQSPPPKTTVERYSIIRARISSGTPSPAEGGSRSRNLYTLKLTLDEITEPVQVRVTMTDELETKTLLDEVRSPNDEILLESEGIGAEVTFNVYYNGELKLQIPKKPGDEPAVRTSGPREPPSPTGQRRRRP
jgi:serine/threonine-protein kinase